MKKIYLGNTLIHDEKEYNEMKESINTLKTNLEGVTAPVTYTGSVYENNGHLTYNFYGDNPLRGNLKKLKPGDILQLFQLSESGEELSANTYTILNGSDNSLTGSEDHKAVLMLNNFNELLEIRTNYSIHKTSSETWYFTNSSDSKLVPQNPVNSAGVTLLSFNDVKPGDVFIAGTYYYILTQGLGYYSTTDTPIKAVVAITNHGKLVHILTDGSITPVDAETLNGYEASENSTPNTIPVRDEGNVITAAGINTSGFSYTFTSTGWYRILNITKNSKNRSNAIGLKINSTYNVTKNCSYTFEINNSWDNISINQFASISTDNIIPKIRIGVKDHDTGFIDIYYESSGANTVDFSFDGMCKYGLSQDPVIVEGYTTTEFTTVNSFKSQINNEVIHYNKTRLIEFKVGSTGDVITTEQFISKLNNLGALIENTHTTFICSWSYSNNDRIDTPAGRIQLAGAIIRVYCQYCNFSTNNSSIQIEITTASQLVDSQAYANNIFVYRRQDKIGVWKRLVNSDELPLKGSTNNFTAWTAIPCETKIYSGGFQSDVTINCSKAMPVGESVTLIMRNTTNSSHTINLTNFGVRNVDTITVETNKRAEINIMALNTTISDYHVRGINYED